MSDSFVIDELGNCRNKFQSTKKYGKVEIYPIVDTMNENHTVLFCNELLEQKLNQMTNNYVNAVQENEKLTAILRDLNIDEDYYWNYKLDNPEQIKTNIPIGIKLEGNSEFKIMEMVCTLKNIIGEYTYCKGTLVNIYSQMLNQLSNGNIIVHQNLLYGNKIDIEFKNGWEKYDVPKDWEHNAIFPNSKFNPKVTSSNNLKSNKNKRKAVPNHIRVYVFERDNYTCQMCGRTITDGIKLHLDHIKPVSKGGDNSLDNLQVLCSDCNHGKHNKDYLKHDKRKLKELKG